MSSDNQASSQEIQQQNNDKDINFAAMRNKYERQIAQIQAEKDELAAQVNASRVLDEDDTSEPYVDHKKLNKSFNKFGQQVKQETKAEIQHAVNHAISEERKNNWLKGNPDFYDVLKNAEKLAMKDPELAESILDMPEGFERQKLVYKSIKSLGLDREAPKAPSIQEKIDANRRSPYYQPSGVGAAPYANTSQSDFSPSGQKNAYDKMQELKSRLRL